VPPKPAHWIKRWVVLFGAWIGILKTGFMFNSSTLLIPYIDAHNGTPGSGVLCITLYQTAW
jgi:hypothetical protein